MFPYSEDIVRKFSSLISVVTLKSVYIREICCEHVWYGVWSICRYTLIYTLWVHPVLPRSLSAYKFPEKTCVTAGCIFNIHIWIFYILLKRQQLAFPEKTFCPFVILKTRQIMHSAGPSLSYPCRSLIPLSWAWDSFTSFVQYGLLWGLNLGLGMTVFAHVVMHLTKNR